ncbi:MAG: DUF3467 domain-containing protein [archaeon]|nr:MAG: DUF3467 domain-containing protein [archaeon]
MKKKILKVEMDNGGPAFFSDTVTVSHNPKKFILDFQQLTPRFTKIGSEEPGQKMFLSHNAVMLDTEVAKEFSRILNDNVKNYEKRFGELKIKKAKKPEAKKPEKVEYTGYIG